MSKAQKTILFVLVCVCVLSLTKLVFGLLSGSVIVLASALDSLFDVLFSLFNFFALKKSENPPSKYFNYGFGKIEGFASFIEGVLIAVSGLYVIYQAVLKIYLDKGVDSINHGIAVMILSICVTILIIFYLARAIKKSNSLILRAELVNYKTDLLSNLGVIFSLFIIYITKLEILDGIIGIFLGLYICFNAFKIIKNGFFMLLDKAVSDELQSKITSILDKNKHITSYHDMKSRISGNVIFLEYHLVFDEIISLMKAHEISILIEKEIEKLNDEYKWVIMTHLDPYDDSL